MAKQTEMTAIAAAKILGVGLDYLYSLLWTGKLKGRKAGERWLIPASAVEARLHERRKASGLRSAGMRSPVREPKVSEMAEAHV
jgi:excisionase family DNA binding protein